MNMNISCVIRTELEAAFSLFDKNARGYVSTDDFRQILQFLGQSPSDQELKLILEEFDSKGNFKHCSRYNYRSVLKYLMYIVAYSYRRSHNPCLNK